VGNPGLPITFDPVMPHCFHCCNITVVQGTIPPHLKHSSKFLTGPPFPNHTTVQKYSSQTMAIFLIYTLQVVTFRSKCLVVSCFTQNKE
jgi:hypothetical protein